jgi:hypothetical protein
VVLWMLRFVGNCRQDLVWSLQLVKYEIGGNCVMIERVEDAWKNCWMLQFILKIFGSILARSLGHFTGMSGTLIVGYFSWDNLHFNF